MSAAKVTHVAAEFGLCQVVLQKLEYTLVAMTFTRMECNMIMSAILTAGLPSAGSTRTFPRAMVHGPWQWGGLNIPSLFMEQTTKHLHTLMKFGRQLTDMTRSLLQASCEAFRLESGLSGTILELPECMYSYMTTTWVTQMWELCCTQNIQVIGEITDYPIPRWKDVELMRLFIWVGCRNMDLNMLNRCQLYLHVVFLSDICNVGETKLEQHLWNQLNVAESQYKWPKVPKPTPMEWRLWQQVPQQATSVGRNLALPLPLGKWHPQKENSPGWYYQAQENALHHQTEDGYT